MNKQTIKVSISIIIGLILSFNVGLYAWSGLQAETGDKLSLSKWNELASNVWGKNGYASYYTAGNVGIGTSAPSGRLSIGAGPGYAELINLYGSGLDGSTMQRFALYADSNIGTTFETPILSNGTKLDFRFGLRGGEHLMTIKGSSGNIGIGTSNPTQKLDIAGYAKIDGAWYFNDSNGGDGDKWGFYGRDDKFVISKRNSSYTWVKDVINIRENGFVHYGNFNGEVSNIISNTSNGNNSYSILRLNANGSSDGVIFKNSSTRTGDGGVNTMVIRNDGGDLVLGGNYKTLINPSSVIGSNVGIGTHNPENSEGWSKVLNVNGVGASKIIATTDAGIQTGLWAHDTGFYGAPAGGLTGTKTNHPFTIVTNSSSKMVIGTNGYVGIGTMFPSTTLHVNGSALAQAWNTSSDQRYKKDIKTIESPLDKISKLRGVTFNWRTGEYKDKNFPAGNQVGFIAQEVEKVIPQIVTTDDKGYKSVQYSNVTAVLVEAVKELKDENNNLRKKDEEKNKEIQKLIKRIEKIETK